MMAKARPVKLRAGFSACCDGPARISSPHFPDGRDCLRLDRLTTLAGLISLLVLASATFGPSRAQAQCDPAMMPSTCNRVGSDGKGLLGGLILGAEIGFITNALIVNAGVRELDEWWAWTLIPAVTAAGGALGGYYGLEDPVQADGTRGFPEAAVAVFAVSMALIVPTFVGVLALTAYNPGPDTGSGATGDEDSIDEGGPPDEGNPDAELSAGSARERVLAGGPGALRFDRGRVLLGIPMISTADTYTAEERAHMHLPSSTDIRVPVVSGTF